MGQQLSIPTLTGDASGIAGPYQAISLVVTENNGTLSDDSIQKLNNLGIMVGAKINTLEYAVTKLPSNIVSDYGHVQSNIQTSNDENSTLTQAIEDLSSDYCTVVGALKTLNESIQSNGIGALLGLSVVTDLNDITTIRYQASDCGS